MDRYWVCLSTVAIKLNSVLMWTIRVFARTVTYVIVWVKTCIVCTKTEFNFIVTVTDALNIYPSSVCQVLNVNWSAFLKGVLPTLQSHDWNNGTNGGCQLDSGDLYLLPQTLWLIGVSLATVWASWLLIGCPKWKFLPPPISPIPPTLPILPTLSIRNTNGRKRWQNYHEI